MRLNPLALAIVIALPSCAPQRGGIEETVAVPRAQLYSEFDAQVTALQQAVEAKPTQTGTPPVPVKFDFVHDPDRHLRVDARAGYRTVTLDLYFEDGSDPSQTILSADVVGMSDAEGIEPGNIRYPVQTRLGDAVNQALDGVRIAALFGKASGSSR